jgi:hypothetical protein
VEILCNDGIPLLSINGDIDPNNDYLQSYPTFMTYVKQGKIDNTYLVIESYRLPFKITNLLGIVSWGGAVHVASSAPNNIDIHGTVMATSEDNNAGFFQADAWNSGSVKGTATLLGGVISYDYGAFGQFNSQTGNPSSGYARNFVYDKRMMQGKSPPYYPSLSTFIAFTNDITDKLVWQGMN